MSVTKSNGSLQILQARLTWSPQERRLKDTRCTLPTCSRSLPPSVCFFLWEECPLILMTMQWGGTTLRWSNCGFDYFRTFRDYWDLIVSKGKEEKGTPRIAVENSGTVWNYFVTSQILSLPLCSLFSPPLIFTSVSPLLSCLSAISVFTLNPTVLTSQESYKCSEWIM